MLSNITLTSGLNSGEYDITGTMASATFSTRWRMPPEPTAS